MRSERVRRLIVGAAFLVVAMVSVGMSAGTTAQAQDRDHNGRWDRYDRRNWDRNGDGRPDWDRRWDRRGRVFIQPRVVPIPQRRYPNYYPYGGYRGGYGDYRGGYGDYRGGYGDYRGGYNNGDVQRGFRDGLDRGQEDARDRRSPNPNNSSHYRSGNGAYREGFRSGYAQGYRQYAGYGRW